MKVIIAGGRDYILTEADFKILNKIHASIAITQVVSGGARGVDTCGEEWADRNGISVKKFPADWDRYGKFAGFIRNSDMARYADKLIAFPGGKGTAHMIREALSLGMSVRQVAQLDGNDMFR